MLYNFYSEATLNTYLFQSLNMKEPLLTDASLPDRYVPDTCCTFVVLKIVNRYLVMA